MKKGFDIYNFAKRTELALKALKESKISKRNKKIILDFRDFCSLEGISLGRIERYLNALKDMATVLGCRFRQSHHRRHKTSSNGSTRTKLVGMDKSNIQKNAQKILQMAQKHRRRIP